MLKIITSAALALALSVGGVAVTQQHDTQHATTRLVASASPSPSLGIGPALSVGIAPALGPLHRVCKHHHCKITKPKRHPRSTGYPCTPTYCIGG